MLKVIRSCIQVFVFFIGFTIAKRVPSITVPVKLGQNLDLAPDVFVFWVILQDFEKSSALSYPIIHYTLSGSLIQLETHDL